MVRSNVSALKLGCTRSNIRAYSGFSNSSEILEKWTAAVRKQPDRRRVVITGLGIVSPLGIGIEHNWNQLVASKCGVGTIKRFNTEGLPLNIAALVPEGSQPGEYNEAALFTPSDLNRIARFVRYALVATEEALKDAQWVPSIEEDKIRTGVVIGSGIASMEDIEKNYTQFQKEYRKVSPFFIPQILTNSAAGQVSIKYSLKGVNHTVSTACSTGANALGDAAGFIRAGLIDVAVAGSTESSVTPLTIAGFARLRALAKKFQDVPSKASRPFDRDRDGFVMGEGAGIVVLEELEHALSRNAKIYAELKGYGLSADAYHITSPCPSGQGAIRAMQMALINAGMEAKEVGYVNAHATGTPLGDPIEDLAIRHVFGDHASNLDISSTKGATGHLLGAAGSVEAIFTIMALHRQQIPPTLNLDNPDAKCVLNYTPHQAISKSIIAAMSNSFAFGGSTVCLLFSRYP